MNLIQDARDRIESVQIAVQAFYLSIAERKDVSLKIMTKYSILANLSNPS